MHKKSPAELQRAKVTKATRALIRLKHSLAADDEINATLPDTLAELEAALARGELRGLSANLADVVAIDTSEGA